MKKRIQSGLLFLIVLALLGGCAPGTGADPSPGPEQTPSGSASADPIPETGGPEPTASPEPEPPTDPIADQLAELTTEQKVGQLLVAGIEGTTAREDARTAIV